MSRFIMALVSLVYPALVGAVVFGAAGRWDLPFVWGVLGALALLGWAIVAFCDVGMIRERRSPGPGNQDRITRPIGGIMLLGSWVLTGLDVGRYQWSLIPQAAQFAGLIGYAVSLMGLFWAVRVNPFYSSVVRVQTERGHYPVMVGPYRFVRHPGYAASLLAMLTGGVALGSWLAMLPLLGFAGLFVRRTLLEDRLLQQELAGYAEYAEKVRYRLISGLF